MREIGEEYCYEFGYIQLTDSINGMDCYQSMAAWRGIKYKKKIDVINSNFRNSASFPHKKKTVQVVDRRWQRECRMGEVDTHEEYESVLMYSFNLNEQKSIIFSKKKKTI